MGIAGTGRVWRKFEEYFKEVDRAGLFNYTYSLHRSHQILLKWDIKSLEDNYKIDFRLHFYFAGRKDIHIYFNLDNGVKNYEIKIRIELGNGIFAIIVK